MLGHRKKATLQGAPTSWGLQIGKDGLSERHSPLETAEEGCYKR